MASLLGSVFSDMADIPVDQTLAANAAASSSSAAQAYLSAAVASTTPEVRRLFMGFCTQSVMGNETLMALMAVGVGPTPTALPSNNCRTRSKRLSR